MLKQKFILHFFTGLVAQMITAVTGILVARLAGPEIVGTVAYGMAFVSVFGVTLGLFGSSHMKLVSEGQDHGNCVKTFSILQTLNILLFAIVFCGWLFIQMFVVKYHFQKDQLIVIIVYFLFFVISQFLSMWQLNFSATIEIAKNNIPYFLQTFIYNITRVIVVLLGLGAVVLTSANFAGLMVAIPITWYFLKKLPKGKFDKHLAKKYFSVSFWFLIITICGTLVSNFGRLMLEHYADLREVGLFTAGSSIAAMLLLISSTTGTIFFPLFSKLVAENKIDRINHQIRLFERITLIFLAPPVLLISFFSAPLIHFLLGNRYALSGQILSILIITAFFQIVTLPHGNLIAGRGWFKMLSYLNIGQLIVFIISLFVFLDHRILGLGGVGLAWAMLISNLFLAGSYLVISITKGGINTLRVNYKYYLSGFLLYLIIRLMLNYFEEYNLYFRIGGSFFIVIIYFAVLFMKKWLGREDIILIADFINPRKLLKYIKSEM